jgi:hypothetical protein
MTRLKSSNTRRHKKKESDVDVVIDPDAIQPSAPDVPSSGVMSIDGADNDPEEEEMQGDAIPKFRALSAQAMNVSVTLLNRTHGYRFGRMVTNSIACPMAPGWPTTNTQSTCTTSSILSIEAQLGAHIRTARKAS